MNEDLTGIRITELFLQLCSLKCRCDGCVEISAKINELTEDAFGPPAL